MLIINCVLILFIQRLTLGKPFLVPVSPPVRFEGAKLRFFEWAIFDNFSLSTAPRCASLRRHVFLFLFGLILNAYHKLCIDTFHTTSDVRKAFFGSRQPARSFRGGKNCAFFSRSPAISATLCWRKPKNKKRLPLALRLPFVLIQFRANMGSRFACSPICVFI